MYKNNKNKHKYNQIRYLIHQIGSIMKKSLLNLKSHNQQEEEIEEETETIINNNNKINKHN